MIINKKSILFKVKRKRNRFLKKITQVIRLKKSMKVKIVPKIY